MSVKVGRFPPSVAQALQKIEGSVSFTFTPSSTLACTRRGRLSLMETPYENVLATLSMDADHTLFFTRTGSRDEPMRVARTNVSDLIGVEHWVVTLTWNTDIMAVSVRDQDIPRPPLPSTP